MDDAGGHLLDTTSGAVVASDAAASWGGVFDPTATQLLFSVPALGDAPTTLLPQGARQWQVATGSKVVALTAGGSLQVLDASNTSPPVTLASDVASFAMSHDGSRVVYLVGGAFAGLYASVIP